MVDRRHAAPQELANLAAHNHLRDVKHANRSVWKPEGYDRSICLRDIIVRNDGFSLGKALRATWVASTPPG